MILTASPRGSIRREIYILTGIHIRYVYSLYCISTYKNYTAHTKGWACTSLHRDQMRRSTYLISYWQLFYVPLLLF